MLWFSKSEKALSRRVSCLGKCKPFPERVTQWARGQITNPTVALLIITKEASHFIDKQCCWLIDM